MAAVTQTTVILLVTVIGALGQAAITARWYEPPAEEGRDPSPLFEAALFFVMFGVIFGLAGALLAFVEGLAPPYTRIGILLLSPVGIYSSYATYTGRMGTTHDRATKLMGVLGGAVIGAYPPLLVLV